MTTVYSLNAVDPPGKRTSSRWPNDTATLFRSAMTSSRLQIICIIVLFAAFRLNVYIIVLLTSKIKS